MIMVKFLLLHYSLLIIWGKYSIRKKIGAFASKVGQKRGGASLGRFLYNLKECVFCYNHLGGVFLLPFLFLFLGVEVEFLLFPLMSTGAIFLIGKQVEQ